MEWLVAVVVVKDKGSKESQGHHRRILQMQKTEQIKNLALILKKYAYPISKCHEPTESEFFMVGSTGLKTP